MDLLLVRSRTAALVSILSLDVRTSAVTAVSVTPMVGRTSCVGRQVPYVLDFGMLFLSDYVVLDHMLYEICEFLTSVDL
jgi:hypothetical protein